jgi:FKBP-type peptidyl-prolyl cis-trans isomerase
MVNGLIFPLSCEVKRSIGEGPGVRQILNYLFFNVMIIRVIKLMLGLLVTVGLTAGCSGSKKKFIEHESGLKYKFIEMNPQGKNPKRGDILLLSVKYLTEDGKLVDENSSYRAQLANPTYEGDFFTGLGLMQVGDSVHFLLDAADYYTKTKKRDLPMEFVQGDKLLVEVRLKNTVEISDFENERRGIYHTDEEQELSLLRTYLENADVQVEPTESGMYIIILEEGSGPLALPGQTLTVHYTGKSIDGKVFDSSLTRGKPIEFILGAGNVIKGWDEGFTKLRKGSKARFIIPSKLAYGANGFGEEILPYSTLIFEVELIDIK